MPLLTIWKLWPLMSRWLFFIAVCAKRSIVNRYLATLFAILTLSFESLSPSMVYVSPLTNFICCSGSVSPLWVCIVVKLIMLFLLVPGRHLRILQYLLCLIMLLSLG